MRIRDSKRIAYWGVTGLFAGLMVFSGVLYVTGAPMIQQTIAHLGYPGYLLAILGPAKLIGAASLLQTRSRTLREWAYAGFTIDLIGAIASHLFTGDSFGVAATPAVFLLLLAASYGLKPLQMVATATTRSHAPALAA